MRRGRGERRTSSQSSSSTQNSTRRRGRSTSRADSRASDRPRRRSRRIAGLAVTGEDPTSFISGPQAEQFSRSVAEVETTRQQQRQPSRAELVVEREGTPARARQYLQTSLTLMQSLIPERPDSPEINGAFGQSIGPFRMELIAEPPAEVELGVILPPIVARLRPRQGIDGAPEFHQIMAWIILTTENGDDLPYPDQTDMLRGNSIASVSHQETEDEDTGYIRFEDLTIQHPGRYRLRICLVRMESSQDANRGLFEGGTNIQMIHSRVVHVRGEAHPIEPCRSHRARLYPARFS